MFRAHRSVDVLNSGTTYGRFRCTRRGDQAGQLQPTGAAATFLDFFPDDRGWKRLADRLG